MEIKETLLVSKESILGKEHNCWIGFSFANKWFTDENLKGLIGLGLAHTKESLLVWVPSRLYATNLIHVEKKSRAEALRAAFEIADEKTKVIRALVASFSEAERQRIVVAQYDDIVTPTYVRQKEILLREFSMKGKLYDLICEIAEDMLSARGRTVSKDRAEGLSMYVIQELPVFLSGIRVNSSDILYTVILYPGLGKIDYLVESILNDDEFFELRTRLDLQGKTGIASII